jgi:hypothetical protein
LAVPVSIWSAQVSGTAVHRHCGLLARRSGGAGGAAAEHLAQRADPHALARLGNAECASHFGDQPARQRHRIDAFPTENAMRHVLRTRLIVERACTQIMADLGAALGPHPYCGQRRSARLLADLPVWLRQSHAERDLATLASSCLQEEPAPCLL